AAGRRATREGAGPVAGSAARSSARSEDGGHDATRGAGLSGGRRLRTRPAQGPGAPVMIRINLLPQAKKPVRGAAPSEAGSQGWLIAYLVATVLWGVGLAVVYITYGNRLDEQKQQNANLSADIERIRQKSAGLEQVKAQIE